MTSSLIEDIAVIEHLGWKWGLALQKTMGDLTAKGGLTEPQYMALMAIAETANRQLTAGEIAHRLMVKSSTATDLADRLETAGLIERLRIKADRRVVLCHLTDKGRATLQNVAERRTEFLMKAFEGLDHARIRAALEALIPLAERVTALGREL
ncbi:MAG TPA: MarR family transcriptional regulator [Bacillota bacterium]